MPSLRDNRRTIQAVPARHPVVGYESRAFTTVFTPAVAINKLSRLDTAIERWLTV